MFVTTESLLAQARAAADMADNFVTKAQWLQWMNNDHKRLSSLIARAGYIHREVSLAVPATGADSYNMPEPLAIIGVHQILNGGYIPLEGKHGLNGTYPASNRTGNPQYWYANTADDGTINIKFYPKPISGDFVITYIATPLPLVFTPDAGLGLATGVNYPMAWEEWIVMSMASRAILKEEGDTRGVDAMMKKLEMEIEHAAFDRALNDAPTMRNVDSGTSSSDSYATRDYWRFF